MKQTQRHNGIIELVKQQGYVSTEELVEHFSVSPQTIRRDLNELAGAKPDPAPSWRCGAAFQFG
ncbi:DNA-binding transcriptional repressor GlpR [Escherichia coli]|uniref:DNA-binding transcriptional repressor GlpR n=1 Tax=Escherichia coli TaxID=562 RepID=A0A377DAI0_ECOLX|nr:DNA-binding transcriptional repressor GlpR [Escherichia coli]